MENLAVIIPISDQEDAQINFGNHPQERVEAFADNITQLVGKESASPSSQERTSQHNDEHCRQLGGLVQNAAQGNEEAWNELCDKLTPIIRAVARQHRLSAYDVEDIIQTTWLTLIEHIDGLRDPLAIAGWLRTVTARQSLNHLRKDREQPSDDVSLFDCAVEPINEQRLVERERSATITTALESLGERDRQLLALLFASDRPDYIEISKRLDMPVGSIGPTRVRALSKLSRIAAVRALA